MATSPSMYDGVRGGDLREVIRLPEIRPGFAMPFNHRFIDGAFLITSEVGEHAFLEPQEFQAFIEGRLDPGSERYGELAAKGFIASEVDIPALVERYRLKKGFLAWGPTLHAMVLTERCNHGCQYCHSSVVGMGRFDTDMTPEVAERCVDMALSTTSPWLTIEFQGGEPTANWETLTHIVRYGRDKNRLAGKELSFALVTNFSLMTEEMLDFLIEHRVQVCTSLDGPEDLHNSIRIYNKGNSYELTTRWIRRVNERYVELGLDPTLYRVEALPTITRDSLSRSREIVDTYVEHGCRAIFLRKLDPFGFAAATAAKLGYTMHEFNVFYEKAVDYVIELNKQGVEVMERNAAIMLYKILEASDPNYLDLRTPGGAVIGQMAYHPSGRVYSSDEGRMVAAMGDDIFEVGDVSGDSAYYDVLGHPTVRALIFASTNDSQPDCVTCTYKTYCGQQPEYNYKTQGSIFGRMRDSNWCLKHKYIFDYLMKKLRRADPEEMEIFRRWTTHRRQEHFIQQ